MFNAYLFNEHSYNYQKEQYVNANLSGYGMLVANMTTRIHCSGTLAGYGIADFAYWRRCFIDALLPGAGQITTRLRSYKGAFNEAISIETTYGETLTIPANGVLNTSEGSIKCWISLLRNPGTTEQFIFDGAGAINRNMQVLIKTDGRLGLRYGTGATTIEIAGPSALVKEEAYWVVWRWSSEGVALFLNGEAVAANSIAPDISFGSYVYGGSKADGTCQLDGLIDDLCISSRAPTNAEIAAAYQNGNEAPLELDKDTTYLMRFDGNLNVQATYVWTSPAIDASNATNKASGHVALTAETPGNSVIAVQSRSAPASVGPWTDWVNALVDGTLQHTADNFVQVRLTLTRSGEDDPNIDELVVIFDGMPAATLLASDFTAEGQFYFDTLLDNVVIVNGINAPRKYDGTTIALLGGSPPHARYVAAHKNRLWLALGSRLYFSELLNFDDWPVLNFIDISPNDGDTITGIMTYGDYLIITKGHSLWMLTGDGIETFMVRRIHADRGAYAPRSLIKINDTSCFVSDDGIYLTDFTQAVLISERIRNYWRTLNPRRLSQVASWFYDHKLYVAAPSGSSIYNNTLIVYDVLRQAFIGVYTGWNISCWTSFREGGRIASYYGSSTETQVTEIGTGFSDNGMPYTMKWRSKEIDFGAPEIYKRLNKMLLQVSPAATEATIILRFYVNGQYIGEMPVVIPAGVGNLVHNIQVLASKAGVVGGQRLALEIAQEVLNNPVGIQLISIEHMAKGIKPTIFR